MNKYLLVIFFLSGILLTGMLFIFLSNISGLFKSPEVNMEIVSSSFENLMIPVEHTADGQNTHPPISINNIPEKTKTLVIIMEDVDTPQNHLIHWIVLIPIEKNQDKVDINKNQFPPGTIFGRNSFGETKYFGPDPKIGTGTHRYFFTVYALKKTLDMQKIYEKHILESEMNGFIIQKTEMLGVYKRLK